MAKRITGNDTPLVSVRQEDKDKMELWLDKLSSRNRNRTFNVAPPSVGNKATNKATKAGPKKPPKKQTPIKAQGKFDQKKYEEQLQKYYGQLKKR